MVLPDDDDGIAQVTENMNMFGKPWNCLHGFSCPFCYTSYGKLQYHGRVTEDDIKAFEKVGVEVRKMEESE